MARNENNFNVNLTARPWGVVLIEKTLSWLFDFNDNEGKLSIGKTIIKVIILLLLVWQGVRFIDWTKEVRGIDPNLRTDGWFTISWQHDKAKRFSMPEDSMFVIHNERGYVQFINNEVSYIYPSDFNMEIEQKIFPGMCQMVMRGQRARFSSHSPPWYVRGMKMEVIYDPPDWWSFLKPKRSWGTLSRSNDWWAIPTSESSYRSFIAQAREDENGLICVPNHIIN